MKDRLWFIIPSLLLVLVFAASCAEHEDADKPWKNNSYGPGGNQPDRKTVVIEKVTGAYGDIRIDFLLDPEDESPRDISVDYRGGCFAAGQWAPMEILGETEELAPGRHSVTWYSWEQEAGCGDEVEIRISAGADGEFDTVSLVLENNQPGQSGYLELPLVDQGINDEEASVFDEAVQVLIADPIVDFVATRYFDTYEVHAARGSVLFRRNPSMDGYEYEILEVDGVNPIERQDPMWIPTYQDELAAGSNPSGTSMPELGYGNGDPRMSFIEAEDDSYPFGYERIAAYFDHPDSADFMINWTGYAHGTVDVGEHGSLNITQSRCPLVFWGKGIEQGSAGSLYARQVDIAPTVATLLGFEPTYGVDERGIWTHDVLMTWQDGHVLDDILTGETTQTVILIVTDGLAFTELQRNINQRPEKIPNLMRLVEEGAMFGYGSTTNWPSVTYPSHNVIGSGVYSGHHGLVDNEFWYREDKWHAKPISQLVMTDSYWNPLGPAETLHQAANRNLGWWNSKTGKGAFTASLLDPSVHGADKADIEFRDKSHEVPFPPLFVEWPKEIPWPDLNLVSDFSVLGEELLVMMAMVEFYYLYQSESIGIPDYVIFNNMTTDGAGHVFGPHGDKMDTVVTQLDQNLGVMFDWLEEWGLADDATIILTADHGMQIGDINRSGWPIDILNDAGIKLADETWLGCYLKIMVADFEYKTLEPGVETGVRISVMDEDDFAPVEGATIHVDDGNSEFDVLTDPNGEATFTVIPAADVEITLTHPDFNDARYVLEPTEE